ncbi:DUF456 domain-containing protein [Haloarcula nitratireducens]|uniref:DUF456 domain-containing protein n=1 Tax=Haloarcula nitratireducens TaxID=2487749 RepID=A0AAW4P981_9EURY|nr:DUF456 domain-containing protein [Halomicroarcula nitratireducens]MBX0294465.1 DUF456 domain-containing protein [Halomicroarcula nitratireducens]
MITGTETILVVLAFALLVGGVVGSLVPQVPGALLSLAGVYVYWYAVGLPLVVLVGLTLVGVLTWIVDFFGGAVAARVGGASTTTAVVAGIVGLLLFFVTGPVGLILGVAATVFAVEFWRQQDAKQGLRAALVTTAGMLASSVVQALLTGSMLVTMVVVAL